MSVRAAEPPGIAGRAAARAGNSRATLGFVLRFAVYWGLGMVALAVLPALDRWGVKATVASLVAVTRWMGVKVIAEGDNLAIGRASLQIVPDCTSLMPTLGLWAAITAFPAPASRRAAGALAGAAALWVYNLGRVLALVAVLQWRPEWFDFIHVYLWQTMTILVVCALFLIWLRRESHRPA